MLETPTENTGDLREGIYIAVVPLRLLFVYLSDDVINGAVSRTWRRRRLCKHAPAQDNDGHGASELHAVIVALHHG